MKISEKIISMCAERNICLYSISESAGKDIITHFVTPSSLCHNSYSIAKVFTMTAIGMLYDRGMLSLDDKIFDILKPCLSECKNYDSNWESVTIEDTLLHKMGIESGFLDIDTEDILSYGTNDFLLYSFSKPLPLKHGEKRVYSDAAYYLLSRCVEKISGKDLFTFLREKLFNPLSFREAAWSTCPRGYSIGATGLYIRTDDMIKPGMVYLDGGIYRKTGERIVSQNWVELVLSRGYELKARDCRNKESYAKGGMYGQMLYFCKTDGIVVGWHAFDKNGELKKIMNELDM